MSDHSSGHAVEGANLLGYVAVNFFRHAIQVLDPSLLSYHWLRHSDRSITFPEETVAFSSDVALDANGRPCKPPMRFYSVQPPGIVQTFSRFNPLIFYCLYGDESFYKCLQLSLRSLAEHGRFEGTLAIGCDRAADEVIKYIPETFHGRLIISEASKDRGWFNRYYLEHGHYDSFQPILYCDTDINLRCGYHRPID